jgi:integrase
MQMHISKIHEPSTETEQVSSKLNEYFSKLFTKLPKETQRAYKSDLKAYFEYCAEHQSELEPLSPEFDIQKKLLLSYIDYLVISPKKNNVIKRHLASISKLLRIAEIRNPLKESEFVRDYLKAKLRATDDTGRLLKPANQKQARPIDDVLLMDINKRLPKDSLRNIRNLALINFCFDTLLRRSEISQIQVQDLDKSNECCFILKSKTDQAGSGSYRYVSEDTFSYIDNWLFEAKISHGPIFRRLAPNGSSVQDEPISGQMIYYIYKSILKDCGYDSSGFSAHSTRVGAAVTMARVGVSERAIKQAGGWKSDTYLRYTAQTEIQHSGSAIVAKLRKTNKP